MERIDEGGIRRGVEPHELAAIDQLTTHHNALTARILALLNQSKEAAGDNDTAAMARVTAELGHLCRDEWPDAPHSVYTFIMHLANLLEEAQDWTRHVFQSADMIIRAAGGFAHPGHPLHSIPGFSIEELAAQMTQAEDLLRRAVTSYVTDTGVEIVNVHLEQACKGEFCVIHRPVSGPWDDWDTHWDDDQHIMMRRCGHGVDHPAMEEILRLPALGVRGFHVHPGPCDCACDLARTVAVHADDGELLGFRVED